MKTVILRVQVPDEYDPATEFISIDIKDNSDCEPCYIGLSFTEITLPTDEEIQKAHYEAQ